MTQAAINNAKVLYQLSIERAYIEAAEEAYNSSESLKTVLESPIVSLEKKYNIIDRIFALEEYPKELNHFFKVISRLGQMGAIGEIFKAYYDYWNKQHNIILARVQYAQKPETDESKKTREFLAERYPGKEIQIKEEIENSLLGGIRIQVGNEEYDNSYDGRLRQLERILIGR